MHQDLTSAAKKSDAEVREGETPEDGAISTPLAAPTATSHSQHSKQKTTPDAAAAKDTVENPTIKTDEDKEEDINDETKKDENLKGKRVSFTSIANENPLTSATAANATAAVAQPPNSNSSDNNSVRRDPEVDKKEEYFAASKVEKKLPDALKWCLADDWDAIERQHKLHDIPAKVTVQDIVDQYTAYRKETKIGKNTKESNVTHVLNGIIEYFNLWLGSQLLYKFERPQYDEVLQQYPDTPPSKLYSGFHLLRLLVKLGPMLRYSNLVKKSMQLHLDQLQVFMEFLVKNKSKYFSLSQDLIYYKLTN